MEGVLHQGATTLAVRRGLDDLGHLLHLSCAAARRVPYRPPTWCALSRAAPPVGDVASGFSLLYATRWGTRQAAVGGAHLLLRGGGICRGADGTNAVLPPATWRHRLCCPFVMVGIGLPVGWLRLLLCQVWATALSLPRNLLPRTVFFLSVRGLLTAAFGVWVLWVCLITPLHVRHPLGACWHCPHRRGRL